MVIAEWAWLHTLGQIAGTILVLELSLGLLIAAALMVALALGAIWLRSHVMPIVQEYTPRAQQAMQVATMGSDKVAQGVAEFYGRRQQLETGLRVLLFGKGAAERVHEESQKQAASDLWLMSTPALDQEVGAQNGFTPVPLDADQDMEDEARSSQARPELATPSRATSEGERPTMRLPRATRPIYDTRDGQSTRNGHWPPEREYDDANTMAGNPS